MKFDSIKIKLVPKPALSMIFCEFEINDTTILIDSDFFAFLLSKNNHYAWSASGYTQQELAEFSGFYPFTCSCGEPGCSGYWDGIRSKHRKRTVEWRIPSGSGYGRFLSKSFYRFSTEQYESEIAKCWKWLKDNSNKPLDDYYEYEEDAQDLGSPAEDEYEINGEDDSVFYEDPDEDDAEACDDDVVYDDEISTIGELVDCCYHRDDEDILQRIQWFDSLVKKYC